MDTPWEESLDLSDSSDSDSNLPSLPPLKRHHSTTNSGGSAGPNHSLSQPFFRRCSQNSQNNPPLPGTTYSKIPGPAGAVQAAMIRRKNQFNEFFMEEEPIPTQEYIKRAVEDSGCAEDDDFSRDPWLSAIDFVRRQGLMVDDDGAIGIPLRVIKTWASFDKVAQVIAIVKSCRPNGLGDMMVTLKDPTGTIDASVHHRVLNGGEFGKGISVGAVIIVQKVAVFWPTHSARYLNITHGNVIKHNADTFQFISKGGIPPPEGNLSAPTVEHAALGPERNTYGTLNFSGLREKSQMTQNPLSFTQRRTEGIMDSLRQHAIGDAQMKVNAPVRSSCHNVGSNRNQNSVSRKDNLSERQDLASGKEGAVGTDTGNGMKEVATCEQLNNCNKAGGGNTLDSAKFGNGAAELVSAFNNQEKRKNNGIKDMQHSSSRPPIPQWTDEQLEELFAFD